MSRRVISPAAIVFGRPVLCSNVTSLPGVAGDAAICFDPNDPHEVAAGIDSLVNESGIAHRIRRGREPAEREL
jgi:glycosyltransferase involved in cell wall biosynthesis